MTTLHGPGMIRRSIFLGIDFPLWICRENRVYSQWNSYLIGIMISKTIGFRGTQHFQTHPYKPAQWKMNRFRFKGQGVATSIPPQIGCPANLELSCSSSIFHWKPHHAVGFLLTKVLNWKATIDPPPKNRPRLSWKSGKVIYFERKPTWYDSSWFDSKPTVEHDAQHDVPLVSQTVSPWVVPSYPIFASLVQNAAAETPKAAASTAQRDKSWWL